MTLLVISLIAGVLTVLSPCVLPLLPVIVGGSVAGGKSTRRALTVTAALGVSVFVFTILLKVSTALINVPEQFWTIVSGTLVVAFGLVTLFPSFLDALPFVARLYARSNRTMSGGFMRQSFWGDVVVGASLGPVFSTCSPTYFVVLATVLPVSIAAGVTDILAYILGLCAALLIVSLVGQRILDALGVAADPRGLFKRAIGLLFVLVGVLILTGYDKVIEAPLYSIFDETKIEQQLLATRSAAATAPAPAAPEGVGGQTDMTGSSTAPTLPAPASPAESLSAPTPALLAQKAAEFQKAPELVSPDAYLNTDGQPVSLAQYRGKKVVLLDFWTYSCINCQRTLPYLTAWYQKYKDQGLVVLGVHTPEFAFEHVKDNVAAALKQFGITYPVALDNEYRTWNAYGNQFWPHEYVIDIDGYIVHDHIGEGEYDLTEKAIQAALAERMSRLHETGTVSSSTVNITPADLSVVQSPETYFGAARNEFLANGARGTTGTQTLTEPAALVPNQLYLSGTWDFSQEQATNAAANAKITYEYSAKNVYLVASSATGVQLEVLQDGKPVGDAAGADVKDGVVTVKESRLYHLVANPAGGAHTLELIVKSPGLAAYTFTFG